MAHITMIIDTGTCPYCYGSGWNENLKKQQQIYKIKRRKPTQFDIDKCNSCHGSGICIKII
jgi:hypothetical protein